MTLLSLLVRTLACFALVFATWNPTGHSYISWLQGDASLPAKLLLGVALLALYILFLRIAWLSLGPAGVVMTVTILLTGTFALSELGAVDLGSPLTRDYLTLTGFALLLTAGTNWSRMKRRVTGQSDALYQPP